LTSAFPYKDYGGWKNSSAKIREAVQLHNHNPPIVQTVEETSRKLWNNPYLVPLVTLVCGGFGLGTFYCLDKKLTQLMTNDNKIGQDWERYNNQMYHHPHSKP